MEKNKNNYGSFICSIPVHNSDMTSSGVTVSIPPHALNIKEHRKILVKPLSQRELAEGWSQVIRKPEHRLKDVNGFERKYLLFNTFTVNLAQLPEELWNKMTPVYDGSSIEYYRATNMRYKYIIEHTSHDNQIRRLRHCLLDPKYHVNEIRELVNYLDDNDIYGWVKIRASMFLDKL
jgi:hypothetical protein